ncbi:MAG: PQQ-binding-like beta-propeller repeat protein [Verrucomicrobiales bacterium]|nr:PQQ-binding-like beta-propeller repeat protein [Verrucomicrobiales bacterium]
MKHWLFFCTVVVLPFGGWAGETVWPQFRGPRGDGTSAAQGVPMVWAESSNLAWKVSLPGRGRSSPVVLGERVWLTSAVEQGVQRTRIGPDDMQTAEDVSLRVLALEAATGRVLWETVLFDVAQPDPVHWLNSWATPTPAVEAGRLYCDFGTFGTACLDDATGEVLWKTRVPLDHQVGPGSSPVLYERLLILARDGRDAQFVTAVDKATGEAVWRVERPPINTGSPNLKKSFATPLLLEAAGRSQLVSPAAHWVVSYDPVTGRELWRARHGDGFSIGTGPVFAHGLVLFGTGCFKAQLFAIGVDGEGDVTTSRVAWKTLRQVPIMSSPVAVGDEVYWVSDEGMATCADARTGEIRWQERLGGGHLASPLAAEGRVYYFAQDGRTTVVRAGPVFEELARNKVEGTVIATPAMVDGTIYLRTDTHLHRIGRP